MEIEWTGQQQLLLLLQSAGLGCLIGAVFDLTTGLERGIGRRWLVWLLDGLFGVTAALITFFGALAIMDGRLHPLLFGGILCGFLAEHTAVGRYMSRLVCGTVRLCRRGVLAFERWGENGILRFCSLFGKFAVFWKKKPDSAPKSGKKFCFFSKKA